MTARLYEGVTCRYIICRYSADAAIVRTAEALRQINRRTTADHHSLAEEQAMLALKVLNAPGAQQQNQFQAFVKRGQPRQRVYVLLART